MPRQTALSRPPTPLFELFGFAGGGAGRNDVLHFRDLEVSLPFFLANLLAFTNSSAALCHVRRCAVEERRVRHVARHNPISGPPSRGSMRALHGNVTERGIRVSDFLRAARRRGRGEGDHFLVIAWFRA